MKIANIANTGANVARVYQGAQPVGNPSAVGEALARGGANIASIGVDMVQQQAIEAKEKKRLDDDLEQAQAANATLDHEIYVKETTTTLENDIASGSVHYKDADTELQSRLKTAPTFKPSNRNPILNENYNRGIKRVNFTAQATVGRASTKAMQADYKNQFGVALEKMQKLAGMPGADIENLNTRAESLRVLAKKSGMPDDDLEKTMQTFKDNNWFNQASQNVLEMSDDAVGLQKLRYDLTNEKGAFAEKLDATKRTSLLKSVDSHIEKLNNRALHAADKAEAKAERAVGEMDKQVASSVPATPQQVREWQETVAGTPYEKDFKQYIDDENEVQETLRKPINKQLEFLQGKEQDLATNGGDLKKQANVRRLSTAVNSNVKLLKENPLIFNQNRTGVDVQPLDIQGFASGQADLAGQMRERFTTVLALRRRHGPEVSLNPWLPQEAEAMKAVLSKADDKTKLAILGVVAQTSGGDAASYGSALKTIAGDKGMLMMAGMAKFNGLKSSTGRDVAETILAGERVLADKSVIMPTEAAFNDSFTDLIENAIPNTSPMRLQAYNAFKTIYAGIAQDQGIKHDNLSKTTADSDLAKQAIALATGGIAKYNGERVITPYGMGENSFISKVDIALDKIARETGYAKDILEDLPLISAYRDAAMGTDKMNLKNAYFIKSGSKVQKDKNGKPLIVFIDNNGNSGVIKK